MNEQRRVAIIEDDPDLREIIEALLQQEGYDVTASNDPADLAGDPDIFLIDMMLSTASGIEIAVNLRAHGHADTPMVAMSASPLMLAMARTTGMFQAYLAKPYDFSYLLELIQRLLVAAEDKVS